MRARASHVFGECVCVYVPFYAGAPTTRSTGYKEGLHSQNGRRADGKGKGLCRRSRDTILSNPRSPPPLERTNAVAKFRVASETKTTYILYNLGIICIQYGIWLIHVCIYVVLMCSCVCRWP